MPTWVVPPDRSRMTLEPSPQPLLPSPCLPTLDLCLSLLGSTWIVCLPPLPHRDWGLARGRGERVSRGGEIPDTSTYIQMLELGIKTKGTLPHSSKLYSQRHPKTHYPNCTSKPLLTLTCPAPCAVCCACCSSFAGVPKLPSSSTLTSPFSAPSPSKRRRRRRAGCASNRTLT